MRAEIVREVAYASKSARSTSRSSDCGLRCATTAGRFYSHWTDGRDGPRRLRLDALLQGHGFLCRSEEVSPILNGMYFPLSLTGTF